MRASRTSKPFFALSTRPRSRGAMTCNASFAWEIHRRRIGYADGYHLNKPAYPTALHSLVFSSRATQTLSRRTRMNQSFSPIRVGRYTLPNRLVMAPMTRSRAKFDGTPGDLAAEYYSQRAGVGLIVTEGTQPSDDGQGYLATPGIYTPAHVAGWNKVTTAVHDKGGR